LLRKIQHSIVIDMRNISCVQQRIMYIVTYKQSGHSEISHKKELCWCSCRGMDGIRLYNWTLGRFFRSAFKEDSQCADEEMNLYHYHMALKLKRRGRVQVCDYLDEKFEIKVNFSDHHNTYWNNNNNRFYYPSLDKKIQWIYIKKYLHIVHC
jgi:hypothetical protein